MWTRVPALHWDALPGEAVRCRLCPKLCLVRPGAAGDCLVRVNVGGTLWADGYGILAALAVEPVEKKPLFHFHPGSRTLSLGTYGCNMHCDYCQNWTISQRAGGSGSAWTPPAAVLERAIAAREADGRVQSICFTYTEPSVSFEYLCDVGRLARDAGFRVILKTNGFVSPVPWGEILGLIDAANIDLKGMDDGYYARVLGGRLGPVRDAIEEAVRTGIHVEVTTLLVPDAFDDLDQVDRLSAWLAGLDPSIPLHLPRFYPDFQRGGEPAPRELLLRAARVARHHLRYVYLTGSAVAGDTDTLCASCGGRLVRRQGLAVWPEALAESEGRFACGRCGADQAFRGMLYWPRQPHNGVRVPPRGRIGKSG